MKTQSIKEESSFTPRGLTSNWNFLGHYTPGKKRQGGEFVSRLESATNRRIKRDLAVSSSKSRKTVNVPEVKIEKHEDGSISWVGPRKNGKFGKKYQMSASLAAKMGII